MRFVFLDRDGVINRFPGRGKYVTSPSQLKLTEQSIRGLRRLKRAGFFVAVISNQGCVSRGMITKARLHEMTDRLLSKIRRRGGGIDAVHYCYHQTSDGCSCKKPKTLLLEKAFKGTSLDRKSVFFVGDSLEDMQAARSFGCKALLVLSGRTRRREVSSFPLRPDHIATNLDEASKWLTRRR